MNVTTANNTNLKGENRLEKVNCFTFLDSEPKAICFSIAGGIASGQYDENGNFVDNEDLNLKTKTITYSNSTDSSYSSNNSFNVGTNIGFSKEAKDPQPKDDSSTKINSTNLAFSNSLGYQRNKTLATLGKGNIDIQDKESSDDIRSLNRDSQNISKTMINMNYGVDVDATLDHRLLTEEGREEIKDDVVTASAITNAIEQIVTSERAGILDFFNETEKNVKVYEGMKEELASNPELAQKLSDPNITPQDKQAMLQAIANTVALSLGYKINDVKLISTNETGKNDEEIKGHYNNGDTFVNDKNNQNTNELVSTIGHETQHSMDAQYNQNNPNNKIATDEKYNDNFGIDVSFYTSNALDHTNGGSLASSNSHTRVVTSVSSVFNDPLITANNTEFSGLDKSNGDNSIYLYRKKVVATDGVNNHMIVALNSKEVIEKGLYLNTYLKGRIQNIASEDISKYDNVYNLTNQEDLETLRQGTDMIYDNINKDTKIVMITGMNNDFKSAKNIQNNILGKDFNNVGLINNQTDKTFGVLGDILEWTPNYLTTKDVLNAEMLQRLSPNTLIVTHSAGNPDIKKANQVNELVGAKTPYLHYSVASPESATNLESSDSKVGAIFIKQTNNPNDPVANGWLNKDADYEYRGIIKTYIDLINNHPFENYYNNGVRQDINKVLNNE